MFFFNDTATTEIYTLSLHDALPIYLATGYGGQLVAVFPTAIWGSPARVTSAITRRSARPRRPTWSTGSSRDRQSTRLKSSHAPLSYAVFCLKKTKQQRVIRVDTPPA